MAVGDGTPRALCQTLKSQRFAIDVAKASFLFVTGHRVSDKARSLRRSNEETVDISRVTPDWACNTTAFPKPATRISDPPIAQEPRRNRGPDAPTRRRGSGSPLAGAF